MSWRTHDAPLAPRELIFTLVSWHTRDAPLVVQDRVRRRPDPAIDHLSWNTIAHQGLCHVARSLSYHRARMSSRALQPLTGSAPHELASCHLGPRQLGRAWHCWPRLVGHTTLCMLGRAGMQPSGRDSNEIPFYFPFRLNSYLNFENSYLSVQSSKNSEISSIGFVISRSIYL
jgi:hypothetical protein